MKKLLIFIVCVALVFAFAWYVFTPEENKMTGENEATAEKSLTFPEFWSSFRSLVLDENTAELAQNTEFPLEVSGSLYDSTDFPEVFNSFLKKKIGPNDGDTEFDLIRRTNQPAGNSFSQTEAKVGGMTFSNDGIRWLLTSLEIE